VTSGATGGNVTFASGGILQFDSLMAFGGTISGFTLGDEIDLRGLAYTSGATNLSWTQLTSGANASGTLTVKEGSQTQSFTLVGSYTSANFSVTSDGHGGTLVTDPPITSGGMKQLDSLLSQFAGFISGFDLGDEIGPRSLGFGSSSSAVYRMREASVANVGTPGLAKRANIFDLTLLGQYGANFIAGADHGGTLITDPPVSNSVAQTPLVAHH
jgi:hypothetical protein